MGLFSFVTNLLSFLFLTWLFDLLLFHVCLSYYYYYYLVLLALLGYEYFIVFFQFFRLDNVLLAVLGEDSESYEMLKMMEG